MSEREELAAVLGEHGVSGNVNSREGWVECLCGERLPCALDSDGYPLDDDAEDEIRASHFADAVLASPWLRDLLDKTRAEALGPVHALADEWEGPAGRFPVGIKRGDAAAALRAAAGTPTHDATEEER